MKVHGLDDGFDTLRGLDRFERPSGHDVTVWNDHVEEVGTLVLDVFETGPLPDPDGQPIHMINPEVWSSS
ncbi:MAG: hypothetical protein R3F54_16605 [Alphaproteobacteria bacterium]